MSKDPSAGMCRVATLGRTTLDIGSSASRECTKVQHNPNLFDGFWKGHFFDIVTCSVGTIKIEHSIFNSRRYKHCLPTAFYSGVVRDYNLANMSIFIYLI